MGSGIEADMFIKVSWALVDIGVEELIVVCVEEVYVEFFFAVMDLD